MAVRIQTFFLSHAWASKVPQVRCYGRRLWAGLAFDDLLGGQTQRQGFQQGHCLGRFLGWKSRPGKLFWPHNGSGKRCLLYLAEEVHTDEAQKPNLPLLTTAGQLQQEPMSFLAGVTAGQQPSYQNRKRPTCGRSDRQMPPKAAMRK